MTNTENQGQQKRQKQNQKPSVLKQLAAKRPEVEAYSIHTVHRRLEKEYRQTMNQYLE
jgi:hypothetical protein